MYQIQCRNYSFIVKREKGSGHEAPGYKVKIGNVFKFMTAGLNNVLLPRLFKVVNDIVQHCYISLLLLSTQQLVHNLLVEISDSLYKVGLKTLIQTCCNKVARKLTTQLGTNSSNTTCRQIVSRLVTTCAF